MWFFLLIGFLALKNIIRSLRNAYDVFCVLIILTPSLTLPRSHFLTQLHVPFTPFFRGCWELLTIANSSSRGEFCAHLLSLCWALVWFQLAQVLCAVTAPESSHVQPPCCVQRTPVPCSNQCLWLIQYSHPLVGNDSQAFGGKGIRGTLHFGPRVRLSYSLLSASVQWLRTAINVKPLGWG